MTTEGEQAFAAAARSSSRPGGGVALRVCCIADLHGRIPPDVPACDLLLIAGDIGPDDPVAAERFLWDRFEPWLLRQPAGRIVGIAGNHDFIARDKPRLMNELSWNYLESEILDLNRVRIVGSPWAPQFGYGWAFMAPDEDLARLWAQIPDDTEILLSHGPPQGYLDRTVDGVHAGSESLRRRLEQLDRLKLVCCGHIHEAHGQDTLPNGARIVNASLLNERYEPVFSPVLVDL